MKRSGWFWVVPMLITVFAALAIGWSWLERRRVSKELESIFEEHVRSVARLIKEGVREATSALDLVYQLTEEDLYTCVTLIGKDENTGSQREERLRALGLLVWVVRVSGDTFEGIWGPVLGSDRILLIKEVLQSEPGEICEPKTASGFGLYCAYFIKPWGEVVACKSAEELTRLRAQTGLGPLLRFVALERQPVVYAAIQDHTGILASSPEANLSSWSDDPELSLVLHTQIDRITFRLRSGSETQQYLMEGLSPFLLPDGSTAVLRVGIDASRLPMIRMEISQRHHLLVVMTVLLLILAWIGTWLWRLWDRRHQDVERRLAAKEELHRHWHAIGQMAATVAHEVRNPLNTLKMTAQRLGQEFKIQNHEKSEFDQLVQNIHGETERVDRVVGEFLELGRPLVLKSEKVAWVEQIERLLNPLRYRARQEGKNVISSCRGDRLVCLDPLRFGQIVTNLVNNALDAMESGGTVSVVGNDSEDGLHLMIEDDGPGMSEEILQKAEKAFFTTKAKGTGLGLSLTRRLIEAHQGSMRMVSKPGKGTKIELFFLISGKGEKIL